MALVENEGRFVVRISRDAFLDMVMASVEAALVPPLITDRSFEHLGAYLEGISTKKRKRAAEVPPSLIFGPTGIETGGVLFGREFRGKHATTLLVRRMVPVTANRSENWIERSPLSAEVLATVAKAANAPWRVVGDFHSHPLLALSREKIEAGRLYGPSKLDRRSAGRFRGNRVGLIVTVAFAKEERAEATIRRRRSSFFRQIANLNIWLAAYRVKKRAPTLIVDRALT